MKITNYFARYVWGFRRIPIFNILKRFLQRLNLPFWRHFSLSLDLDPCLPLRWNIPDCILTITVSTPLSVRGITCKLCIPDEKTFKICEKASEQVEVNCDAQPPPENLTQLRENRIISNSWGTNSLNMNVVTTPTQIECNFRMFYHRADSLRKKHSMYLWNIKL